MLEVPKEFRYMCTCVDCSLHKARTQVVVGAGPIQKVKYMFVGEAPGEEEDKKGRPFCGTSGKKLMELAEQVGIHWKEVYVTNIVKCRPELDGHNRAPTPREIQACKKHLQLQLSIVNPLIVVAVGGVALSYFCGDLKITMVHGKLQESRFGRLVFPIIHPAAGLRDPNRLEMLKSDLQKLSVLEVDKKSILSGPRVIT